MKQLTDIQKNNIRLIASIVISFFVILGLLSLVHGCGGTTAPTTGLPTVAQQRQTRREAKCAELSEDVDDLRQWCSNTASAHLTPAETHRQQVICRTVSEYDRMCGRAPQQ